MSEGKSPFDRLEERVWASFALHAGQRLTTFNFFIVLSSLLVGAMVTTFQKDFRVPYLGAVVGVLLAMLSFIFWRIDVRNKQLIKLAEKAIMHFEELAPKPDGMTYHPAAFFTREAHETRERQAASGWWHFSYSKALSAVYILIACTGLTRGSADHYGTVRYGHSRFSRPPVRTTSSTCCRAQSYGSIPAIGHVARSVNLHVVGRPAADNDSVTYQRNPTCSEGCWRLVDRSVAKSRDTSPRGSASPRVRWRCEGLP